MGVKRGWKGDFRQKVLVFRLAQRLLNAARQMNTVELDVQTPFLTEGEIVVQLPLGLLGFEGVKKYSLARIPGEGPFLRFKALDDTDLSFLVLSSFEVLPNYSPDIPAEDVQPDKAFIEDLDIDSLSMVEVVVAAEERFGVKIPDDEVKKLVTVGDAVSYIASNA